MTNKEFCKLDTEFYGEVVDNIKQIKLRSFTGEELKEYVEHFIGLKKDYSIDSSPTLVNNDESEKEFDSRYISTDIYSGKRYFPSKKPEIGCDFGTDADSFVISCTCGKTFNTTEELNNSGCECLNK